MLDQSIASGPDSPRVPEPQVLVGHVVCSQEDHEHLKALVREWLDITANYPDLAPDFLAALDDGEQRRFGAWLASKRPWPGLTLTIGECCCRSSITVCISCRDEGTVETKGREVACDCTYDERGAA